MVKFKDSINGWYVYHEETFTPIIKYGVLRIENSNEVWSIYDLKIDDGNTYIYSYGDFMDFTLPVGQHIISGYRYDNPACGTVIT